VKSLAFSRINSTQEKFDFWYFHTIKYRIFSIKCPRRLFQTWPGGPGVYLNQQFIWARHFLREEFYSLLLLGILYLALTP